MTPVEGWTISDLQDLVHVDVESLTDKTAADFSFYYLDIASLSEGRVSVPSGPIVFREAPSRARTVVHRHDVLMSTVRPNLKAFAYFDNPGGPFVASTGFAVLTAKPEIDPRFVLYAILSDATTRQIEALVSGSNYPAINTTAVRQLQIATPPAAEQARIADVLVAVDRALEQTEALVAKQQRIKAGLQDVLLSFGVDEHGVVRSPRTHKFKSSSYGEIPVEWSIGTLLDVTERRRQAILTGPFGADLGDDDFTDEGVPVLRIGNVQQGRLDLTDLLYVSPRKAAELHRYAVKPGDLLFARQGATTGRNALATDAVDGWIINYHIIRVALDHALCAPLFIEAAFDSDMVKRQVNRDKGRGTREGINTAELKALQLKLPLPTEQRRIAAVLAAAVLGIEAQGRNLVKLRRLKSGLMQDLLAGRVRVGPLLGAAEQTASRAC